MKNFVFKLASAALTGLFAVSANALVLDFNTPIVSGTAAGQIPILSNQSGSGFVDETRTYDGFTFEFNSGTALSPVFAWIWVTEGSSSFGLGQTFQTGNFSNGFLAHGCSTSTCTSFTPTTSFAITNSTPFYLTSLDFSRYYQDSATINLYTNISDASPVATIAVGSTTPGFNFIPQTLTSTFAGSITKITVTGVQGFYGIDNINYSYTAPVPEPTSMVLMLAGLAGLGALVRRQGK